MKRYTYGIILGVILSLIIFLSNVVFPNNGPDEAPGMLLVLVIIGLYITFVSSHAIQKKKRSEAVLTGALTSLIAFCMVMITFFIIDNVFLDIVSKQIDKIVGFEHSNFTLMRDYINANLLKGLVFGIPASFVFGLMCGFIGSALPLSEAWKNKKKK